MIEKEKKDCLWVAKSKRKKKLNTHWENPLTSKIKSLFGNYIILKGIYSDSRRIAKVKLNTSFVQRLWYRKNEMFPNLYLSKGEIGHNI